MHTWNKTDFKTVNIFLKRKGDKKLEGELGALKVQYDEWKLRPELTKDFFVGNYVVDNINNDNDSDGDDDVDLRNFEDVHTKNVDV